MVVGLGWGGCGNMKQDFLEEITRFFFQKKGLGAVVETWGDQRARQEKEDF